MHGMYIKMHGMYIKIMSVTRVFYNSKLVDYSKSVKEILIFC